MSLRLNDSLMQAAVTTFEQVVFLLPDSPPDAAQQARQVRAVADVAFTGPSSGVLQLRACEGLMPLLLANMMGMQSPSETLQLDALGEIANIIAGQIFFRLDPESVFLQQPPQVTLGSARGGHGAEPAATVQLGLESSRADVVLYLFDAA